MGYYANGNLVIKKTPSQEAQFVLGFQSFLDSTRGSIKISEVQGRGKSLLDATLHLLGLEYSDSHSKKTLEDGQILESFEYNFDAKWRNGDNLEDLLRYCVSVGMEIDAEFTGEDNESWGYQSIDGVYTNFDYISVKNPELHRLKDKSKAIDAIKDLIASDSTVSSETVEAIKAELGKVYKEFNKARELR